MKHRKSIALLFMLIGVALGIVFFLDISFPVGLEAYLSKDYYGQFGPLAISIELLIAGLYLFKAHKNVNFALALFGFTALLDPLFGLTGLFTSLVPIYATITFAICAVIALWIAFTNTFDTGRITFVKIFGSFLLGTAVELFFNYL